MDIAYLHRCGASHRQLAQYQGSLFLGLVVVALVFPLFSEVYPQSALFTIISHFLALSVILFLPRENQKEGDFSYPKPSMVGTIETLVKNRMLLTYIGGSTMLFELNQVVTLLLAQLCYVRVGIPLALFGFPFLLLVVTSSLVSFPSSPCVARWGALPTTAFAFMLAFVGLLLLSSLHGVVIVILGTLMIRLGAVLVQPLYYSVTAKASEGSDLAMSLSLYSLLATILELVLTLVLGFLAERSLTLSLQVAGGLLLCALGAIYYSSSVLGSPKSSMKQTDSL